MQSLRHKIKLDRLFVLELQAPMVRTIIRGMAHLAKEFERTLVVEGVESPEQQAQLVELGCPIQQGYLMQAPLPLAELLARPLR